MTGRDPGLRRTGRTGPVRRALAGVHWWLRELTGEADFDRYLERHRARHPDVPPLSRREFERRRTDRGDDRPAARCC